MSSALFEYPITELKNVAKQYNLAYYIDNIERLTKSQLIDSILDHMKWKKAQSELENTIDVTLPLAPIKTNYEKVRDKNSPRVRKNYAELRAEITPRSPTHHPIPKYKGRKDWSKIQIEELEPQTYEVIMDGKIPTIFNFVDSFHKLEPADQAKIVNTLGMTEAQALPEGVVAFGDMTDAQEKEVATTVIEAVKEAKKETVEAVKVAKSALSEFKDGLKPRQSSIYYPDMEKWRLVRIAEFLIEKPSLSQSQLGKLLEKDGFQVGTSQSAVSKYLGEIRRLELIPKNAPKPPAETPQPKPEKDEDFVISTTAEEDAAEEEKERQRLINMAGAKLEALKKTGYVYTPPKGMSMEKAMEGLNDLWSKAYEYVNESEKSGSDKKGRYYTAPGDLNFQLRKDGDYVRKTAKDLNYVPDSRFANYSLGNYNELLNLKKQGLSSEELKKKAEAITTRQYEFLNILGRITDGDPQQFYDEELINEEIKGAKELQAFTLKSLKGNGSAKTHRDHFLKKHKLEDRGYSLPELVKIAGVPLDTLQQVYNRGIGAYKTNPTSVRMKGSFNKGVNAPMSQKLSKEQWAMARVYSFLDNNKKHDADLR